MAFFTSHKLHAHEVWLEPETFIAQKGQAIAVSIKNGETLSGMSLPYLETRFERFYVDLNSRNTKIAGRAGDLPAASITPQSDGLLSIVYASKASKLTYRVWDKFVAFATHKAQEHALETHAKLGFPKENFQEVYFRFVKALIGVGAAQGQDKAQGLEIEFVALDNPYRLRLDHLDVLLLYKGAPLPNAQVEVFERNSEKSVTVFTVRTNNAGQAAIPVKANHDYLLDSVVLRRAEAKVHGDALWVSLWAALTFAVPAQ